jgi:hypothetical protein
VLLLVLILVLVAFGLLVVALLTGNVLSAWLSVAVSVAAAVVLIIDWLQRRSAVKAGRAGADSASSPPPEAPPADLDPVTEVLPVYTPDADETATAEKRYDRPADGQQTVVMPAVQPSGSAARPSGAEGPSTPSGGFSSPRVTSPGSEASPGEDTGTRPDDNDRRTDGRSDAEATVVVDIRKAGIGGSSADVDAPGGAPAPPSSADTDRSDADAGNRADRGAAAEPPARDGGETPATDRQAEPAATGTQAGSTGSAAAGAAGLAGAAVAGGLAAAKDRPDDRTTADTQVVNIGKSGDSSGQAADTAPAEQRPAGGSTAGGDDAPTDQAPPSEERRAGVSAPPPDHPTTETRGAGTAGSRPDADPAEHEPTDGRAGVGATGSRADADRAPVEAPADGSTASDEGDRSSTTPHDAPAVGGRAGAWAAGAAEQPAGERRGSEPWASGAATGDTRPANAWATGAAAASNAATTGGGTIERRPSDARGAEPGEHANGTSAATASRAGTDEGDRPGAAGAAAADTSAAEPPARDDQAARTTFGSGHGLFESAEPPRGGGHQVPAQQAASAYEDDTEPPEESADPALGRVAATVEDEVLVIDEQPRYHLMGCRALMAQQTIPLPAREAVELGFTPCGWCNPVAALGARHPASARP